MMTKLSETKQFKYTQVLIVNSDIKGMSKGKVAAQASHGSIGSYRIVSFFEPEKANWWFAEGQRKIVLKATEQEILQLSDLLILRHIPCYIVRDFGLTQIEPDSLTCLGIGPWDIDILKELTKQFKLY